MMKKLMIITILTVLLAGVALAYDSGNIEIEDGIVAYCDSFDPCQHWIDYEGAGSESCSFNDELCIVGSGGFFTINNTPAVVPSGASCNITVNITGLTATTNEDLTVQVNGGTPQTINDQGTGEYISTFSNPFTFVGGSDGSDEINFTGSINDVSVGWYSIQCPDPAVPEFSTVTLGIGLVAILGGIFIIRRKIK